MYIPEERKFAKYWRAIKHPSRRSLYLLCAVFILITASVMIYMAVTNLTSIREQYIATAVSNSKPGLINEYRALKSTGKLMKCNCSEDTSLESSPVEAWQYIKCPSGFYIDVVYRTYLVVGSCMYLEPRRNETKGETPSFAPYRNGLKIAGGFDDFMNEIYKREEKELRQNTVWSGLGLKADLWFWTFCAFVTIDIVVLLGLMDPNCRN